MNPTNKLRFVERQIRVNGEPEAVKTVKILQQWHIESTLDIGFGSIEYGKGEWKDVPIEKEAA